MQEDELEEVLGPMETQETVEPQEGGEPEAEGTQETVEAPVEGPTVDELQEQLSKAQGELEHHRKTQGETQQFREWVNHNFGGMNNFLQSPYAQQMQQPKQDDPDAFFNNLFSDPNNLNQYIDQRAAQIASQMVSTMTTQQRQAQARDKVIGMLDSSSLPFERRQEIWTMANQMPGPEQAIAYVEAVTKNAVGPKVAADVIKQTTSQAVELAEKNAEARHAKLRTQSQPKTTTGGGPGGGPGPNETAEQAFVRELKENFTGRDEYDEALG